jgi:hypothetical protein
MGYGAQLIWAKLFSLQCQIFKCLPLVAALQVLEARLFTMLHVVEILNVVKYVYNPRRKL